MARKGFDKCVFINCPFDEAFEPLLSAIVFCVVRFGLTPRLANERLEAGENRLEKILGLIKSSKFSIHDLSRCKAAKVAESFRMNMPFEYGLDYGLRHSGDKRFGKKRFLVFESSRYELKTALSDTAGHDVFAHENNHGKIFVHMRNFFRTELKTSIPGALVLQNEYSTCLGWVIEKMINLGHSEDEAKRLPTKEIVSAMQEWITLGKPAAQALPTGQN